MDFYLERLHNAIASATDGMSVEELNWHPEGKWSTAEILEHLYRSYTGTAKGFQRCLDAGKPMAGAATLPNRLRAWVVVGLGYLPEGRVAPKNLTPRGLPVEQVRDEMAVKISAMDAVIACAEEKYGKHIRLLDHPFLGPLLGSEWRKFHWVHGRHHLRQIRTLPGMRAR